MKRFVLLVWVAVAVFMFACRGEPRALRDLFPEAIGKLRRIRLITGQEALDEIDRLHGKRIVVEEGAIGIYRSGSGPPVMVWISRAGTADISRQQTEVMVRKMTTSSGSPFHDPSRQECKGVTVYRFLGMGQVHYVFYRGDLAYWISASPGHAEKVLQAFL